MDHLHSEKTNILVIFVTDEQPDPDQLEEMKKKIGQMCEQGGLMLIRYQEQAILSIVTDHEPLDRGNDRISKAFELIKSTIALYPSRTLPIIQEELVL